jgi:Fic family protein
MNAKGVYIRKDPTSLCGRIRSFYEANPGEELTFPDVETKFGCTATQARSAVQQLEKQGVIEKVVVLRGAGA